MTSLDVCEAIASTITTLWPNRFLYRDFLPENHKRPSAFLYVTKNSFESANLAMVRWELEAQLALFCATDRYDISSTEALRRDQEQVLLAFGGPSLHVGDRWISINAQGDGMEVGSAFVLFRASWMDQRPGYNDPNDPDDPVSAKIPKMEQFEVNGKRFPTADETARKEM